MYANNTSGYTGVQYRATAKGDWLAVIQVAGTKRYLGYFDCKHEAAQAYNLAKRMYHGGRGILNEIKY